jgi:hypothetical protein
MLLDWITADASQRIERVLWISQGSDRVVLIDMVDQDSMPELRGGLP